jgi:AbrB family looped-hinge helix DNA binding protein
VKVVPIKDKGDVRIPADMRRALSLDEGSRVLIEQEGDHLVLRPVRARRHADGFLGVFKGKAAPVGPVSCERIEEAMMRESMERGRSNA